MDVGGPVLQLSAGTYNTCALLKTGSVRCWGYGGFGHLGYGHTSNVTRPTATNAGDVNLGTPTTRALQVTTGEMHTCALLDVGTVKCWGHSGSGQLGYGSTIAITQYSPPAAVVNLGGATAYQITAGHSHTCALLSTGNARCWGNGGYGQLGIGSTVNVGLSNLPTVDVMLQAPAP